MAARLDNDECRAVIDQLYARYNHHDAAGAGALYADDGRHEEVAQGQVRVGPEAIATGLGRFFSAFPDARWVPEIVVADEGGGTAAVTYALSATLRDRLGPFEPRGQRIHLPGVHVIQVEDGRIKRSLDYWDSASLTKQLAT